MIRSLFSVEKNPVRKKQCQRRRFPENSTFQEKVFFRYVLVPDRCKCEVERDGMVVMTTLGGLTSSTLAKVRYYAILRQTQLCQINRGEALGADFGKCLKVQGEEEKTTTTLSTCTQV